MRQYKKIWVILTLLCFALTFLPVAAFAAEFIGTFNYQSCSVYTEDENTSAKLKKDVTVKFDFDGQAVTTALYVWFVKDSVSAPAMGVQAATTNPATGGDNTNGIFTISKNDTSDKSDYDFSFDNTGKYTVYAAFDNPADLKAKGKTWTEALSDVEYKLGSQTNHKTIEITSSSESDKYTLQLADNANLSFGKLVRGLTLEDADIENDESLEKNKIKNNGTATIGASASLTSTTEVNKHLVPNGVASGDITFKLLDKGGKAVKGATVKLSTSNTNCKVNKDKVVTDTLGQFSFNITLLEESPHTDGFTVFIEAGDYEAKLKITASSTGAYDLNFTTTPQAPISTDDMEKGSDLSDYFWVKIDDVNGNTVKPYSLQPSEIKDADNNVTYEDGRYLEPAFAAFITDSTGDSVTPNPNYNSSKDNAEDYVSVVSKPAGSKLENKNCWLRPVGQDAAFQNTLYFDEDLIAGDYTIKVTLSSGKYKTISFKVAEMGTPVKLTITPKGQVTELGGSTSASFSLVDANGVTCKAIRKGTDVAVSGYGVASTKIDDNTVKIYTKDDDKYLGSDIKIVATNDRYNLVGESTLNITSGKAGIVWMTQTAPINTPTDLTYIMMDQGKMVSTTIGPDIVTMQAYFDSKGWGEYPPQPGDYKIAAGQTSFVVTAKPEGATVNFDARAAGGGISSILGDCYAVGRVESDKPGVVTLKMSIGVQIYTSEGTWTTRYYEGTQNILFTDGNAGKNVIMSIGSDEAVINGSKTALDASPMIKDNRTFVPFRALAEAFGAEVAYDEATKAVTAELNGIKVVMTIDSATYTVDGKEKTADVAPYVSNGRTMVPVRFAAEAFGSKVTPTYDDKGATADILFTL